jgi:hypothetical protein
VPQKRGIKLRISPVGHWGMTKECSKCKEVKPIDEFSIQIGSRRKRECKGCTARRVRAWQESNKDKTKQYSRSYQIRNRYGLDDDTYKKMLEKGCEVCGSFDLLQVDHNHKCCSGKKKTCGKCVRGMLCRRHNVALGFLRDSSDEARALADYIDRNMH